MSEKLFPIQAERGAKAHPLRIPWSVAERAYSVYAAEYGKSQSLEELAARGGFCPGEMDAFYPEWREAASEVASLTAQVETLRRALREAITIAVSQDGASTQADFDAIRRLMRDGLGLDVDDYTDIEAALLPAEGRTHP